jgi:phage virion morphogenesis protein
VEVVVVGNGIADMEKYLMGIRKKGTRQLMAKVGAYGVSATQKRINRGVRPANAPLTSAVKGGSRTLRDSGQLMASIHAQSGADYAEWGSKLKYAAIHQYGGTISAKGGKLAIPASAKTRTLMRKFGSTPRQCIAKMKSAGWKVYTAGNAVMAYENKGDKPFVLFILKQSIKIPKREYLKMDKRDWDNITKFIETWITD